MKKLHTPSTENLNQDAYLQLLTDLSERVRAGQLSAFRAVNKELVMMYWDIGQLIHERQKAHDWGDSIVEMLAKDLQKAFPRTVGFSKTNLWRIRAFYMAYTQSPILPPLVGELENAKYLQKPPAEVLEIGWSHNYVIIEKCKDQQERQFYICMTKRYGWTKNVLIHKIEHQTFEKTVLSQNNFEQNLPLELQNQAILAVKDEYIFDFLGLNEQHSEFQLEQAILSNIRQFLTEMGGDFCFIANQFPLSLSDKDYRIDLLLYHRGLQSLVAIDLKIGEFEPEHSGKMSFYLSVLDDQIRKPHENACVGIIICKSKDFTTVEFALRDLNKPIGVATYSISKTLPKELSAFFPTSEELISRVTKVMLAIEAVKKNA